jgi:hypothetical protein
MTGTRRGRQLALTGASRQAAGPGHRPTAYRDHSQGGVGRRHGGHHDGQELDSPRTSSGVVSTELQTPISAPAALSWQPGRIHQLAKMKLIDLIALYQSMLPNETGGHDQVAQMAAGGWTKDEVITAIRNLEAPYQEAGGWKRAMQIIGAGQRPAKRASFDPDDFAGVRRGGGPGGSWS